MQRRIPRWVVASIVAMGAMAVMINVSDAQQRRGGAMQGQSGGQGGGQQSGGRGMGRATSRPTSRPTVDQAFDHFDANHDGMLSREEFKEFYSHLPPPPPRRGGQGGEEGGNRPPPPPPEEGQ